ncbi:MAG: hypothetical protein QOE28_1537 [Solirubrobacteraceae bacterium]|nr:hypothetical protein [Solirubrobacteraceae bacterium]
MTRVLVSGAVANKHRHGGSAWVRLSWAEALARLGFEVTFAEELDPRHAVDAAGDPCAPRDSANAAAFERAMAAAGLTGALLCGGESVAGITRAELLDRAGGAALLVNLSGHLRDSALLRLARRRAFVDLDPGYTQVWMAQGRDAGAAGHDDYFTVGANVGTARCPLPDAGVRWHAVRQPVVLERWPVATAAFSRFTTVGSWRGAFGPLEWDGRRYGVKAHEFRPLADVPRRSGLPFEAVLDLHPADAADGDRLRAGGWRLRPPADTAGPGAFADYVRGSGAEFSAAQGVYVHTRSGWCSDRTVRYLASGRPALVQDTGQADTLPVGEGLLTFSTPEEAVVRAGELVAGHARHAAAARRLAETYFSPAAALLPLLEATGVAP